MENLIEIEVIIWKAGRGFEGRSRHNHGYIRLPAVPRVGDHISLQASNGAFFEYKIEGVRWYPEELDATKPRVSLDVGLVR